MPKYFFSKLKIIKYYLITISSQESITDLAILAIKTNNDFKNIFKGQFKKHMCQFRGKMNRFLHFELYLCRNIFVILIFLFIEICLFVFFFFNMKLLLFLNILNANVVTNLRPSITKLVLLVFCKQINY